MLKTDKKRPLVKWDGKLFVVACQCEIGYPNDDEEWQRTVHAGRTDHEDSLRQLLPQRTCSDCGYFPWIVLPKKEK